MHRSLVLSVRASGESNREAVFLTDDEGLLRATVFGGPKSKLKAHVGPYHGGDMHIYLDPVKKFRKIIDFDVREWRQGLRETLDRSYAAAAIAETIIAGYGGGGSWETAYALATETLDALETADDRGARSALLRFLWKWTAFLGNRPDLDSCVACACELPADEVVWYSRKEGGVLCAHCGGANGPDPDAVPLGGGVRAWLRALDRQDARTGLRISADAESVRQARTTVLVALAEALGTRLRTWSFLNDSY